MLRRGPLKLMPFLIPLFLIVFIEDTMAQTAEEIADQYVREALKYNSSLAAQSENIDLAAANRRDALGRFLPMVDLISRHSWADGGREIVIDVNDFLPPEVLPVDLPPNIIPFLRTKEQESKVQVMQPIFTGGSILYSYRAAGKSEKAEQTRYRASVNNLALQVRQSYFGYLKARELVSVQTEQLRLAEEQLRVTRSLSNVDKAPVSDLKRAEAATAAADAALIEAQTQAERARMSLNLLLGVELDRTPVLPAETDTLAVICENPDDLIDQALFKRPELQSLDLNISALTDQSRAVRARYLPMISAAFEYGYQGEKYEFNDDSDYYLLAGVLTWNLFEGFRSNTQMQKTAIARRQLGERKKWLTEAVEHEVKTALLKLKNSRAQHQAALKAREAAEESYRLTEIRFREGMSSQLELMDARSTLTSAASLEVTARYNYLTALAELKRSIGETIEQPES